jgi:hypothetical protein
LKAKRIGVFLLDQEGPIHRARAAYKVLLLEVAPSWDSLVPPGPAPTAPVFLDLPEVGLPQAGEVVLRGVLDSDICIVHKLYISFKRSFANNSIQYRIGMEGVYYMEDSPPTIALLEELATYAGTRFANLSHWHMICFMRFFICFTFWHVGPPRRIPGNGRPESEVLVGGVFEWIRPFYGAHYGYDEAEIKSVVGLL